MKTTAEERAMIREVFKLDRMESSPSVELRNLLDDFAALEAAYAHDTKTLEWRVDQARAAEAVTNKTNQELVRSIIDLEAQIRDARELFDKAYTKCTCSWNGDSPCEWEVLRDIWLEKNK